MHRSLDFRRSAQKAVSHILLAVVVDEPSHASAPDCGGAEATLIAIVGCLHRAGSWPSIAAHTLHTISPDTNTAAMESLKEVNGVANPRSSPFFSTPPTAETGSLAILQLKRDNLLPITLRDSADDGYAEGAVTNTRFGSFPHSTLIGLEWGSQVRASKVDTGTRGRKDKQAAKAKENRNPQREPTDTDASAHETRKKRPSETLDPDSCPPPKKLKEQPPGDVAAPRAPVEAGSGFVHILPPTPESWTASLDHRTQVVYTPDYSYILQRLRVRPGDTVIEAGAGSGSFTHAAARAVFNGRPPPSCAPSPSPPAGRVYSFEYHLPRVHTLQAELDAHALTPLVHLTHRDVCADGFVAAPSTPLHATAVFLDLPAPWLALPHLTRRAPLHPSAAVHICSFSPCIEQVIATAAALRRAGWTHLTTHEIAHRRLDVRRERVGLHEEGLRGVTPHAASVAESVARLREVETKLADFRDARGPRDDALAPRGPDRPPSKAERLARIRADAEGRKLFLEGRLVHRAEPEVKTHTSYLVFAVLPPPWSAEDEERARRRWPVEPYDGGAGRAAGKG